MRLVLHCADPQILHVSDTWLLYSLSVIALHKLYIYYLSFFITTQFFELSLSLLLI